VITLVSGGLLPRNQLYARFQTVLLHVGVVESITTSSYAFTSQGSVDTRRDL
jgi:hypothetical protein